MVLLRSRTGPAFNSEAGQAASPTLTPAPATSADCAAPPPTPATPAPRPGRSPRTSSAAGTSDWRSEEHTSELQSLMRTSYAVSCLRKKKCHFRYKEHKSELQHIIHQPYL